MRKNIMFLAVIAAAMITINGNVKNEEMDVVSSVSVNDTDETMISTSNKLVLVDDDVVFVAPTKSTAPAVVDDDVVFVKPSGVSDNTVVDEPEDPTDDEDSANIEKPNSEKEDEAKVDNKTETFKETKEEVKVEPVKVPETKTVSAAAPQEVKTEAAEPKEQGIGEFVERLYNVALGRGSDPAGKESWIAAVKNGGTGADLARGFLYSPEFLNKNVSNEEFVRVLYKTFFNREPDTDGFNAWVAALNNGSERRDIVDGFIGSNEYANLCLSYRVDWGTGAKATIRVEPTKEINDFTERLYSLCLGRHSDPDGLKGWSDAMANMEASGARVAHGFFFSNEFLSANYSNAEYVRKLYNVCLNREPDSDGFRGWVEALNNGASREEVFNGFAHSTEFKQLCAAAGIIPGNERYAGTTRVVTNNASKTWIKETVDTGRRKTSPIYETYMKCWCNTCGKELNMYDPNDEYPELTHMFETAIYDSNGNITSWHNSQSSSIAKTQIGTFQERILETHERCLETGEIRNRTTFEEEGGERRVARPDIWGDR